MVYQLYSALLLCALSTAYNTGDASYGYGLAARAASAFASSSFEYFVNICSLLTPNSSIEMIDDIFSCCLPACNPSSAHSALSS